LSKLNFGIIGYERKVGYSKKRGWIFCYKCHREVRDDMITDNGCIWCDTEYHSKEKNNG